MTPQLYLLAKRLKIFVAHHHPVMFIALVSLLLGLAIYLLYQILTLSMAESVSGSSTIGVFDKRTVEKIKDLHISSGNDEAELVFPSSRPNPFVE